MKSLVVVLPLFLVACQSGEDAGASDFAATTDNDGEIASAPPVAQSSASQPDKKSSSGSSVPKAANRPGYFQIEALRLGDPSLQSHQLLVSRGWVRQDSDGEPVEDILRKQPGLSLVYHPEGTQPRNAPWLMLATDDKGVKVVSLTVLRPTASPEEVEAGKQEYMDSFVKDYGKPTECKEDGYGKTSECKWVHEAGDYRETLTWNAQGRFTVSIRPI